MKFKNLHEETIIIDTPKGRLTARPGEFIELDEQTYKAVRTIYTKLEEVVEKPAAPVEKPKANKKCK